MNKCVKITFQPIIWRDENLNNASAGIGSTTCHVFGETKEQLFENIKQKIWAMSSEARILDEEVAQLEGKERTGRNQEHGNAGYALCPSLLQRVQTMAQKTQLIW